MASRVNTKFVVILIAAVIAMLAAVFAAYTIVLKSAADLSARGDAAMAAGEIEQAVRAYSRAVNKEPTNDIYFEKWIDALGQWVPSPETVYRDTFRNDYLLAINHASTVQRTNVEAYERELSTSFKMLDLGYSRGLADSLIKRTTEALGPFDGVPGVDENWPKLRRFRGLAWQRISAQDGIVEEAQYELVDEDLRAAYAIVPEDPDLAAAIMRWMTYVAQQSSSDDNIAPLQTARAEAIEFADEHLAAHPDSPMVALTRLAIAMEIGRTDAAVSNEGMARTQAIRAVLQSFASDFMSIRDSLMEMDPSNITVAVVQNFQLLEALTYPESGFEYSHDLIKRVVDARADDAEMLRLYASLLGRQGRVDEAAAAYDRLVAMPIPPLSVEGWRLFDIKRESYLQSASMQLDEYERLSYEEEPDAARMDELLKRAESQRATYASLVSEDDRALMLLDGRIAYANDDVDNALRLFKRFNEQTQSRSWQGVWLEAMVSRELNQLGAAREALQRLLELDNNSVRCLLMLADVEVRLQELRSAKLHFERALQVDPDNRTARDGIANINALQNPDLVEDPVLSLILKARQLRRGTEDTPGDLSSAIDLLQGGIASLNYAPDATRELASLLLDAGDVAGARVVMDKAVQENPDDEQLREMQQAMLQDDPTDILIDLIGRTQDDPVEAKIAIANVAFARGREALLDQTVTELLTLAPNDPRVIDIAFVRSLGRADINLAKDLAERATKGNTDRVGGLSYQARVASFEDDHMRAVQLLEQAVAMGTADSAVFRMLAIEQRLIGRLDSAIESFERSLSIRPDDQSSIIEYMGTLIQSGRLDDALDVARRFQRYAMDNTQFVTTWLTLESSQGGEEGRDFAIKQREKFLELNPGDVSNKFALASLYIEAKRWDEAQTLIDNLVSSEGESLRTVGLKARWYADQGRVGNVNGLAAARQVFTDFIEAQGENADATPYIAMARFMLQRGRPDLAVQAAADAVEREDPETLEGSKLLGDLLLSLNQYTNAAQAFERVIDAGVDENDQYRLRLIDMNIRTRQFKSARENFDALDEKNKGTIVAMLQNAEIEEGLENTAKARELLDQAVAAYPENPIVYIKRAEFLAGDEATMTDMLADIDAALRISQDDWRAYRVRAAGFFAVDRRDEAMRDLQRAVRLNPALDQALFGIINEMMIDGRNAEAYDFALEIVEQRPRDGSLVNSLGQLFASRDDWENATAMYKHAWEMQRSPTAGATLIDAIVRTRNPDTALANEVINDLTQIAGDINKSPGLLAAQALVLQARGRNELALQQLTKAFDISSNDDTALMQWSGNLSRFFESGTNREQIAYMEELKRRNTNPEVLNWLDLFIAQRMVRSNTDVERANQIFDRLEGMSSQPNIQRIAFQSHGTTLYTQGRYEEAAEVWGKGADLYPNDWEMANNLAYVLSSELGDNERALDLAERAIAASPDRSEPYDTIGKVYTRIGRYDEAEQMLNQGMRFALSVRSRITLMLAQIELDLARGKEDAAKSTLLDIRSLLRAMPTRDPGLEADVEAMQERIG